jgi:hypothetical protein
VELIRGYLALALEKSKGRIEELQEQEMLSCGEGKRAGGLVKTHLPYASALLGCYF